MAFRWTHLKEVRKRFSLLCLIKHVIPRREGPWSLAASFPSDRKIPRKFLGTGVPNTYRPSLSHLPMGPARVHEKFSNLSPFVNMTYFAPYISNIRRPFECGNPITPAHHTRYACARQAVLVLFCLSSRLYCVDRFLVMRVACLRCNCVCSSGMFASVCAVSCHS